MIELKKKKEEDIVITFEERNPLEIPSKINTKHKTATIVAIFYFSILEIKSAQIEKLVAQKQFSCLSYL